MWGINIELNTVFIQIQIDNPNESRDFSWI